MVPAAITYLLIWRKDRLHLAHIRGGHLLAVAKAFAYNGLSVYHTDDEAINSLTSVAHARLAIFDRKFLSGISLALVLVATPLLFLVSFFATAKALAGFLEIPLSQAKSITEYIDRAVGVANYVGSRYTDPILFQVFGSTWGYNMQLALLVVAFVVVCFAVFVVVGWASAVLSGILAKRLNSLATFHVAQAVYGGDEVGTTAQASSSHAFDGAGLSHKLPKYIEDAIREAADSAASNTISQLRRRIAILISSIGGHDELDSGSHFLTWDELIHTSYFRAEEMRMLLFTAINKSLGFAATERLAQSRYAPRLGDWLTSIELSRPTASE